MINWFPGHMNKTIKQMQQDGKICDCFLYVLDSRCPDSCINPEFVKVIKDKPIIYILNKSDLVEAKKIKELLEKYKDVPQFVIENHNNIEEMRKKENKEFPKMKRNLIIGIRKTHKFVPNNKISNYLVPYTSSGCIAMCLYCYLVCNYNKCAYLRIFVNREEMLNKNYQRKLAN